MKTEPSPEVKAILSAWVKAQRAKYGENWKEIKAAEMAAQTAPAIERLLKIRDALSVVRDVKK
jgi:hypothetical protein